MTAPFIHPQAVCETSLVGEGTRIWAFAHVLPGARIGRDCNLGENVFVENAVKIGNLCTIKNGVSLWDGVTLEDGVFLGPSCAFTNVLRPRAFIKRGHEIYRATLLKKGCTIGANATIICGVTIGEYAMIGAGTVVTKDVPSHTLFTGNPGVPAGRVCYCGERLDAKDFCALCEKPLAHNSAEAAMALLGK